MTLSAATPYGKQTPGSVTAFSLSPLRRAANHVIIDC